MSKQESAVIADPGGVDAAVEQRMRSSTDTALAAVIDELRGHLFWIRANSTWDSRLGDDVDRMLGFGGDEPDAEWCIARLTEMVDLTDPGDPISTALTRAGLVGQRSLISWRRSLARVSMHPAFPVQLMLDVKAVNLGEVVLECTVITMDTRLPPEVCRKNNQPIWVKHSVEAPADASENEQLQRITTLIHQVVLHEFNECLLVDGRPINDPHGESNRKDKL